MAGGMGHVMRCLAIAQVWRDQGGKCVFALGEFAAARERLVAEGMIVAPIDARTGSAEDATQLVQLAGSLHAEWVVVDGYGFHERYQSILKEAGMKVLFLDDFGHSDHYFADLVLNQHPQASSNFYPQREAYSRLLLGPSYALLRREFKVKRADRSDVPPIARRLLVTMGGCDADNVTERVIQTLPKMRNLGMETKVVIGAGNPHKASIRRAAEEVGGNISLQESPEMPELMEWADLAVTAGGGTCYELALVGVPMFLITMARNHERTCRELAGRGAAIDAGWFHCLKPDRLAGLLQAIITDQERRRSLIGNAGRLVDGKGAERVVECMISQIN